MVDAWGVPNTVAKQALKIKRLPSANFRNTRGYWRHTLRVACLGLANLTTASALQAQDTEGVAHVQTAQFKIPFNIEARGTEALKVQLWVSADEGASWQTFGSVPAEAKAFDFRAAAEGLYLFKVATIDSSGTTYPNLGSPLRVMVDTTKPRAELQTDIDGSGQLVIDVKVFDEYLETGSAVLRVRSDQQTNWLDLPLELRQTEPGLFHGQVVTSLSPCREVAVAFTVKDLALNEGEATCEYTLPRTAAANPDVTLASNKHSASTANAGAQDQANSLGGGPRLTATPGATRWTPTTPTTPPGGQGNSSRRTGAIPPATSSAQPRLTDAGAAPGRLAASGQLSLEPPTGVTEEIPLPPALAPESFAPDGLAPPHAGSQGLSLEAESPTSSAPSQRRQAAATDDVPSAAQASTIGQAFHCKSRAFSLDYSVEALGGSTLADVELWGTEDGGRQWQKWGSDPDRVSPFDVQVGNDGLFGFRMVVVGTNGIVSNRPREGDSADVWINIDTQVPSINITRAVYGEGPEDGLLVIDYHCEDGHLVERPIALAYSERTEGPWTEIATGLANTGLYLWKAPQTLPDKVYLKIECVDKAGNIGKHRLDLPIDIRGLAPRGIIQGFRPIENPGK